MPWRPKAGDVLHITRAASVQFRDDFLFSVTKVPDLSTYDGWMWLEGYQIGHNGAAVNKRQIFVQTAGIQPQTL